MPKVRNVRPGVMEGIDAAHTGSPRLQDATIRQHGMDAPKRKREKQRTYSVREGASIIASKVNALFESDTKKKKGKK